MEMPQRCPGLGEQQSLAPARTRPSATVKGLAHHTTSTAWR